MPGGGEDNWALKEAQHIFISVEGKPSELPFGLQESGYVYVSMCV